MSGPQFVHIETYSRSVSPIRREREMARAEKGKVIDTKLSVDEICGEAARTPGFHPHVTDVKPPTLLYGISPDEIPAIIDARVAQANAKIRANKAQTARGDRAKGERAIRKDTHVLMTMVTSYPVPWSDDGTGRASLEDPLERALYEQWCKRDLEWAIAAADKNGFELLSGVGHTDEEYPHNHYLGVAKGSRLAARDCHPGYIAKIAITPEAGENDEQTKKRADTAYIVAMRAFQDDYHAEVGLESGLTRTGPIRRRVSRAIWHQQKAAAKEVGEANLKSKKIAAKNANAEARRHSLETASNVITDEIITRSKALTAVASHVTEFEQQASNAASNAAEALTRSQALQDELETLQTVIDTLRQQRAADENDRMSVASALEADRTAAAVAKKKRIEAEAATAATIEQLKQLRQASDKRQEALLRLERGATSRAAELDRRGVELKQMEANVGWREAVVEAVTEGIVAYADGRLRYDPLKPEAPFTVLIQKDDSHHHLKALLAPARDKLIPIIDRIDKAVARRTAALSRAVHATLSAWSTGLLAGLGLHRRKDGRPTFNIPETPDGDKLMAKIEPFREEIGSLVAALPDLKEIAEISGLAAGLKHSLSQAEQQNEALLMAQLAALKNRSQRGDA